MRREAFNFIDKPREHQRRLIDRPEEGFRRLGGRIRAGSFYAAQNLIQRCIQEIGERAVGEPSRLRDLLRCAVSAGLVRSLFYDRHLFKLGEQLGFHIGQQLTGTPLTIGLGLRWISLRPAIARNRFGTRIRKCQVSPRLINPAICATRFYGCSRVSRISALLHILLHFPADD